MILYLHGFSSGGASSKAQQLRQLLAPVEIVSPTYPSHDPHSGLPQLDALVRHYFPVGAARLIGSSLGGYYAQYLASRYRDARIVLINPALQPETLRTAIGNHINMVTGEPFEFTREQHAALAEYDVTADTVSGRCFVLLDASDEVIDCRYAAQKYETYGHVRVFADGSHRFEHLAESVDMIREFLGM